MNEQVKREWIKALRSGKYKQGEGKLRIGQKYCCLGVLCDLHRKSTNKGYWYKAREGQFSIFSYNIKDCIVQSHVDVLPENVRRWAGLDSVNPLAVVGGETYLLMARNDAGESFDKIASYIEKGL